jgi:hypothetical protein
MSRKFLTSIDLSSLTTGGLVAPVVITGGKLTTAVHAAGYAALNIPSASTTLTTPASGDLWNLSNALTFYNGTANKTIAYTDFSNASGTLSIANGGTGANISATQYGIPYFATTTTMGSTGAGDSTKVLLGNASGAPTWTSYAGLVVNNATAATTAANLSTTYGTTPQILQQSGTNTTTLIAAGTSGQALVQGASSVAFSSSLSGVTSLGTLTGLTMGGAINLQSTTGSDGYAITGLKNPTNAQDAATKYYVDNIAQGINAHDAVTYATTAALGTTGNLVGGTITTTYNNGTSGVGATLTVATSSNWTAITIDGQSLTANDRVLIKNQASSLQNGIYTVTTVGAVGNTTSFVFTRATDSDQVPDVASGDLTYVLTGSSNGGNGFIQTSVVSTIGTSSITWTQFSGSSTTLAGAGLKPNVTNPNQIDVASTTLSVTADAVDLASISPTTTGSAGTGTVVQSHTVDTYGRVTATTYAAVPYTALATSSSTTTTYAPSATISAARKVSGTIGTVAANTAITVNHGFTGMVVAQLFDSSGVQVDVDVSTSSGITTFLSATTALTGYQYAIVG